MLVNLISTAQQSPQAFVCGNHQHNSQKDVALVFNEPKKSYTRFYRAVGILLHEAAQPCPKALGTGWQHLPCLQGSGPQNQSFPRLFFFSMWLLQPWLNPETLPIELLLPAWCEAPIGAEMTWRYAG